jgi:predicted nucleotidyltransferase
MKTVNSVVLSRIKNLVTEIDPIADVILYGSRARGDEYPESDWDLLILVNSRTDIDHEKIFRHRLYDIELELGEAFSVFVYNKKEWKLNHWMTPLYHNIAREGVKI